MRHLHPTTWLLAIFAMLLSLASCAQLGLEAPQTLSEKIAVTVASATAARQTATTLLQARKITPDDAQHIQAQADNVVAGAQVARSLIGVDPAAADAKLTATRAVLTALQSYLLTKGK